MQSKDRRRKQRFPVTLTLRYSMPPSLKPVFSGTGFTANISSSGVLFRCADRLDVGANIALAVDWPTATGSDQKLRLAILGRVIRTGAGTAVEIGQHWFETVPDLPEAEGRDSVPKNLAPEAVSHDSVLMR